MIEIERKYLLKDNILPTNIFPIEYQFIQQGYLFIEDKRHLRVRIVNNSLGYIAYKSDISLGSKYELEVEIKIEDAIKLYDESEYFLIKNRSVFPKLDLPASLYKKLFDTELIRDIPTHQLMIDAYEDGDIVAEVEFSNMSNSNVNKLTVEDLSYFNLERDVTSEPRYSNIRKALLNSKSK